MSDAGRPRRTSGSIRRLVRLAAGSRVDVVKLVSLGLIVTATFVGQGLLFAAALAAILAGDPIEQLIPVALAIGVLQAVRSVATVAREIQGIDAAARVKSDLRRQLYRKLLELGPIALGRDRSGRLTATFADGVETIERFVAGFVPQLVVSLVAGSLIAILITAIDPVVGVVVLTGAVLMLLAPIVSRGVLRPSGRAWWQMYRTIYAASLDAVQGMTTLKAFGASRRWGAELHDRADAFARAAVRLSVSSSVFMGVVGFAESAGMALSVAIATLRYANGALDTPGLLAILMLSRECFRPLRDLQTAFHQGYAALSTVEGIFEIIDGRPDVIPTGLTVPGRERAPQVTFEKVSFGYRAGDPEVIRDLSLDIAPGETVAVVGRSGAGKTTLVSLLLRFADPWSGSIRVDGLDLRELDLASLRDLVAVVSQDTYLFYGSIRDNIRLARPDASDPDIVAAASAAGADAFIRPLSDGYDTIVGERGANLSGGERQRIAIARALLKQAPILVLDEATSAVDSVNEASIEAALATLRADRTTLVIAHRLSTIRGADRIVVLDLGSIVEQGAHDDLLKRGGRYAELVSTQTVGGLVAR